MFGRLSLSALPHDPITIGGVIGGSILIVAVIAALTYFKKWGYLWNEWFTSLDPKKIGVMYIIVALIMLLRGLADAAMLRAQQAVFATLPHSPISPELFQQVFSAHGTIMIFFVAMGMIFGLINLIVPLQIGARDVAFPLLNSISFWLFVAGMVLVNVSLGVGEFSAAGWLAYPPLSELAYSPGVGIDYWIWSLQIAGVGSLLSGVNFLVTIFTMRRKGMTLFKMPVFVWSVLGSLLLVVFAFPILTATLGMLSLDRLLGMHFFTATQGGNPMMYVNLIWAWGHPEVYILVLPAFGVWSEIVPVFSRKALFGYKSMVWAILAIVFLSFTVWLHHFFTMGAGVDVNAFFGMMTMVIAIPTGVKVFNWIFTMFRGRVRFATPMLWFMAFVVTFTVGGVAGVMMAIPGVDYVVHNSLFLVAHFHTMIIGGVLFGAFAAITYWWPKFTGFYLHEGLGKIAFWFWLVGFLLAFIPLYILVLMGAVRRLDTYDPSLGWQGLFIVAGVGVMLILVGVGFMILQIAYSIWKREELAAGPDPWGGRTLEWSTTTPIAPYNFATLDEVHDRDAFWAQKHAHHKSAEPKYEAIILPKNSGFGIYVAACVFFVGFALIWHIWWLAILAVIALIVTVILSSMREETEYEISADDVAKMEKKLRGAQA
jgi:cytochrome o ubiquinol oxidase subunit 1